MAYVLAGIKEAFVAPGNAIFPVDLSSASVFGLGIRNTGSFTVGHVNEMTDKNGRKFPNMLNFKADLNTFQINDMALLQQIISSSTSASKLSASSLAIITGGAKITSTFIDPNQLGGTFVFDKQYATATTVADGVLVASTGVITKTAHGLTDSAIRGRTALLCAPDATTGTQVTILGVGTTAANEIKIASTTTLTDGTYDLIIPANDYSIGCEWELIFSMKERLMKLVFERNMKYDEGLAFLHGAGYRYIDYAPSKVPAIDSSKVVQGYLSLPYIPSSPSLSAYFADTYLTDWTISVKAKGSKNGFGVTMISGVTVELKATASGADYLGMKNTLTHEVPGDVSIDLDMDSSAELIFKSNGLTKIGNIEISDEKREATFTATGEYDVDFITQVATLNSESITFNTYMPANLT